MAKTVFVSTIIILTLVCVGAPLSAHHSWSVGNQLVTVKGTVTEFMWANPHPMINLDVKNKDGVIEKWQVGGPAINRMEANGWNKSTVKPGDVITGVGYQYSDGQKILKLDKAILPDGKEILLYGSR